MSILVSLFPLLESQATYLPDSKVPLFLSWWKSMSNGVQELVPDCHCRTLICKRAFARWFCFDRRGLKQTSVQGGTKLSGRNTNLEAVGKMLRTQPSDIQETGGEEFVDDSPTDRKPIYMKKQGKSCWWKVPVPPNLCLKPYRTHLWAV